MHLNIFTKTLLLIGLLAGYSTSTLAEEVIPPGSKIKYLAINESGGGSQTSIYANDRMKAALTITYELEKGYQYVSAELRGWGDKELSGWSVTDTGNDFLNNLLYSSSSYDEPQDKVTAAPIIDTKGRPTINKFITTSTKQGMKVCVTLNVKETNGTKTDSLSTCDMINQASAFVTITAIPEKHYTYSDFNAKYDPDTSFTQTNMFFYKYYYATERVSLVPINFTLHSIMVDNLPVKEDSNGFSQTLGTTESKYRSTGWAGVNEYMDSKIDILLLKDSKKKHGIHDNKGNTKELSSVPMVRVNSINFFKLYGVQHKIYAGGGYDKEGIYAKLPSQEIIDPTKKDIEFYDIYGNKGLLNITRDSAWGVSGLGYKLY